MTKITADVELHADGRCVGSCGLAVAAAQLQHTTTVDLTPNTAADE